MRQCLFALVATILGVGMATASLPAHSDDYGCTVLLCLANPKGPKAADGCAPSIDRLFNDLRKGRPFPSCDMANTPDGRAQAVQGTNYFDGCPAGTSALSDGSYAMQGVNAREYYIGMGEGQGGYVGSQGQKVCVGRLIGQTSIGQTADDGTTYSIPVGVYDRIVTLAPNNSPRYIDVLINGQLYNRARW